ncbi:LutC/YkgG family protein [Silvibacterium sp.]|uniref:LutC/YkgG family protein n=1 Tax=Silvibacterium sp. TaxID=1964179 RepID=UPI0039E2C871
MSTARAAILGKVRSAIAASTGASNDNQREQEYAELPRSYARKSALDEESRLALLAERLHEYDAGVYEATREGLSAKIEEILRGRGKHRLVLPQAIPENWLPQGFDFVPGEKMTALELDKVDGLLSGCSVAIALTGSLVLQNTAAQGKRALSLVPDYHLCVVFARQVVTTVPEAFARLDATSTLPTTFISGPSATADIEMTRIKGVHGPRFLDVVLVR